LRKIWLVKTTSAKKRSDGISDALRCGEGSWRTVELSRGIFYSGKDNPSKAADICWLKHEVKRRGINYDIQFEYFHQKYACELKEYHQSRGCDLQRLKRMCSKLAIAA
jgi:hypothetical protein